MSRQKDDPLEAPPNAMPLFAPPLRHLSGSTDPQTSRDAAAQVKAGVLAASQRVALDMVTLCPGSTAKELGMYAYENKAGFYAMGPEMARQRIGRRLNELMKAELIHRKGERDGCSLWWPGRDPEVTR